MWNVDFDRTPFLVIWETTQACDLACKHCRASAIRGPIPGELTTDEGKRLIDQVADLGTPLLVLSGGDPATRPDLFDLIRHGKSKGLRVASIPAATPRLTLELVEKLRDAGLDQIAFSIDFPSPELHDTFRGSLGAFERTLQGIEWARKCGIPHQVNTCVWEESANHLEAMAELVQRLEVVFWEVFFLVPVGRGTGLRGLSAQQCEEMFEILIRAQGDGKFILKVTEAPHYRRFLRRRHERETGRAAHTPTGESIPLAHRGVNAGNGFAFVSHLGEVYPSGFLPISAGNVRKDSLSTVYRESPLFLSLRNPEQLKGRCGACAFRQMCGGSRSRAYALTGDWLETDPWCEYEPNGVGAFRA